GLLAGRHEEAVPVDDRVALVVRSGAQRAHQGGEATARLAIEKRIDLRDLAPVRLQLPRRAPVERWRIGAHGLVRCGKAGAGETRDVDLAMPRPRRPRVGVGWPARPRAL